MFDVLYCVEQSTLKNLLKILRVRNANGCFEGAFVSLPCKPLGGAGRLSFFCLPSRNKVGGYQFRLLILVLLVLCDVGLLFVFSVLVGLRSRGERHERWVISF